MKQWKKIYETMIELIIYIIDTSIQETINDKLYDI